MAMSAHMVMCWVIQSAMTGSFRKLMENAEQRILNEFDVFKNDRGSAQKDFESEINSSYEGMKEIIDGLDRELNELKTRAYDSVSEKLKVFEDDFFKNLSKHGENLNTSLIKINFATTTPPLNKKKFSKKNFLALLNYTFFLLKSNLFF